MTTKKANESVEEIADAKGTAVAPVADTAVTAEVRVEGVQLDFPFIRIGQGMSQWKAGGKKPLIGAFYIGKNKDSNVLIAETGKENGIYGIILQKVDGFKEDRKWQAGMGAPKRWLIAGMKDDGTPVTEMDCLEAAAKEGYSLTPKPTGEVWADTGRPKMRANLAKFCYLCMLVPIPEDFDSDEFRVYPIGDKLYTTARYEFDRQYYKQMDSILSNIEARAKFANRAVEGYKWSVNGLVAHLYSSEQTNRDGIEYVSCTFEKALRDGKPWEFTPEEKADFMKFLMSVQAGSAPIDAVGESEFE